MAPFRILPARPGDLPALPGVERAAARRFAGLGLMNAEALQRTLPPSAFAAAQAAGRLWVAVGDDGVPIGFALAGDLDAAAHLHELDVVPEAGRRGAGGALVEAVATWAHHQGLPALTLSTFRDVPWNAPFYTRLGFRPLAESELTPGLRRIRERERAEGLPVERRTIMRRELPARWIVFYDGDCGLCSRLVRRLLAADRRGVLRFAPLQGTTAAALRAAHPRIPADLDSLLLLEREPSGEERVSWRSDAVFRLGAVLGGRWRLLAWLRVLPRALTDAGYDLVARWRHRLFAPPDTTCALLEPGTAARFLP